MSEQANANRDLLDVMDTLHAPQTMEVVQRTRRSVMEAAQRMQESRAACRRQVGIALLAVVVFLLLATPAIWSFAEDVFSEGSITEASFFMLTVFVLLLSTAMGALLSRGRRRGIHQ